TAATASVDSMFTPISRASISPTRSAVIPIGIPIASTAERAPACAAASEGAPTTYIGSAGTQRIAGSAGSATCGDVGPGFAEDPHATTLSTTPTTRDVIAVRATFMGLTLSRNRRRRRPRGALTYGLGNERHRRTRRHRRTQRTHGSGRDRWRLRCRRRW